MTDMPTTRADLDAWIKAHKIAEPAKSSTLPLLKSNIKEFEKIPTDERNAGNREMHRKICQGQWNIVLAAATPRASG